MSRVGGREEAVILQQLLPAVEAYLHPQRQHALQHSEGGEHLLAGSKRRMAPRLDLAHFGQSEADRTDLLPRLVMRPGTHRQSSLCLRQTPDSTHSSAL